MPVTHIELSEDAADMHLHGPHGDAQSLRDVTVSDAVDDQHRDLQLPGAEHGPPFCATRRQRICGTHSLRDDVAARNAIAVGDPRHALVHGTLPRPRARLGEQALRASQV